MRELLLVKNIYTDLGIRREDVCGFYQAMQNSAATNLIGWRVQNGPVTAPEVEPPPVGLVSFYTVCQHDVIAVNPLMRFKHLKERSYAQSCMLKAPFAPWHYLPKLVVGRFARIFEVPAEQVTFKFIETNARLLLHSDKFYGRKQLPGSYDPETGPPGYNIIHESNMVESSVNWTVRGESVPLMVRGKKKFVSNEGATELPIAFNPAELHGTVIDIDRLTLCVRPLGLTYKQVREQLFKNDLVVEVRA